MVGDDIVGQKMTRRLDAYDVFVRRNEAVVILDKVMRTNDEKRLSENVSARKPFGLTNQRGAPSPDGLDEPILVFSNQHQGYLERRLVTNNEALIDRWKVLTVKAHGTSGREDTTILGEPIVAPPGSACTETYLIIGVFDNEAEAQNLAAYLKTRFVRFLVSLRKITQNITRDTYKFVPDLPMDRAWRDDELFAKYGIEPDEVDFIKSLISERN